jgi:hypothetical protein
VRCDSGRARWCTKRCPRRQQQAKGTARSYCGHANEARTGWLRGQRGAWRISGWSVRYRRRCRCRYRRRMSRQATPKPKTCLACFCTITYTEYYGNCTRLVQIIQAILAYSVGADRGRESRRFLSRNLPPGLSSRAPSLSRQPDHGAAVSGLALCKGERESGTSWSVSLHRLPSCRTCFF